MDMNEPVAFSLPKKPRVKQKDAPPDQRKVSVVPLKAINDPELSDAALRCLSRICSFANRAGITWVSQKRLSQDAKMSQQAVSKHIQTLISKGYLEVVRKGFRGERSNTWRVIFDPTVDTDTAIAITSAQEDTRPPVMKQEQEQDLTPDPEGLKRITQIIKGVVKPVKPRKEFTMPKDGQTITTKRIKADIEKAKKKRSYTTPEVVNAKASDTQLKPVDNSLHTQPQELYQYTTSEVVNNTNKEHREVIYKDMYLSSIMLIQLQNSGLTDEQISDNLTHLVNAYQAEGLTPNPDRLVDEILQLSRDAK